MDIYGVVSLRELKKQVFRDVVYEWEDIIVEKYHLELLTEQKPMFTFIDKNNKNIVEKLLKRLLEAKTKLKIDYEKPCCIAFVTLLTDIVNIPSENCIPVFMDIWGNDELYIVAWIMRNNFPFFVTSLDVYNRLKGINHKLNVYYMPLSIADRWLLKDIPEKSIDVVQMGRKNIVLHNYMLKYCEKNPFINYVYMDSGNGTEGDLQYTSTLHGKYGTVNTREEYMELLRKSKVCLFSSPGIDNSRRNTNGIDFPTPRFYESAINYCFMVGRYSAHEEFKQQGIDKIFKKVNSYEEFDYVMNRIFKDKEIINKQEYDDFIQSHITSIWYEELKKTIKTWKE
jgi:hypothetical protein